MSTDSEDSDGWGEPLKDEGDEYYFAAVRMNHALYGAGSLQAEIHNNAALGRSTTKDSRSDRRLLSEAREDAAMAVGFSRDAHRHAYLARRFAKAAMILAAAASVMTFILVLQGFGVIPRAG